VAILLRPRPAARLAPRRLQSSAWHDHRRDRLCGRDPPTRKRQLDFSRRSRPISRPARRGAAQSGPDQELLDPSESLV